MRVTLENRGQQSPHVVCVVERTDKRERYRRSGYGAIPASALLHSVDLVLTARGYELIKTTPDLEFVQHGMAHLSGIPYFLRTRWEDNHNKVKSPHIIIWNPNYALWDEGEEFNKHGRVELDVILDAFGTQGVDECARLISVLESQAPEPFNPIGMHKWQLEDRGKAALQKALETIRQEESHG